MWSRAYVSRRDSVFIALELLKHESCAPKLSKELWLDKKLLFPQTILLKSTRNSHAEYQLPYYIVKETIIFQHSQETIRDVGELVISQSTFYSIRNNYLNKTIDEEYRSYIYKRNSCIHKKLYLTYRVELAQNYLCFSCICFLIYSFERLVQDRKPCDFLLQPAKMAKRNIL